MANVKSSKGGMKTYWRKRISNYSRLRRQSPPTVVLGSAEERDLAIVSAPRRRRFWRIPRKVRFLRRIGSPKRWLARLRDAYVNLMLRFAHATPLGYGYGYGGGAEEAFGAQRWKEYDEKMLVQIYKNLLVTPQGNVIPPEAGAIVVRS
ncbi:Flagellar biosynthesis protein flhA [Rhynchospora pubera]|uniref:Flagellar biosynthesis protein flhA n=1 Tax=Rhynchospora pubera TaxID=906938 RepID=A0AAV8EJC6_9POAL|nr:Flagellar biosynthesis protein flhA [Rhynchospora pubera]